MRTEPVLPETEPAVASTDFDEVLEEDDVDLSFAGPVPVATASRTARLVDLASAYLPLLLMALLAGGTWWLVRHSSDSGSAAPAAVVRHEPDYEMSQFMIQRFGPTGDLQTQIEGDRLRHYPDDDTLEIDTARIRSIAADGLVTTATSRRAISNGDGSEVQLLGDARVLRPATEKEEAVEFRSEFLHAFRNIEQVRSHLPVVVTQGTSVVRADGMNYDNLARVIDLQGRTSATFDEKRR